MIDVDTRPLGQTPASRQWLLIFAGVVLVFAAGLVVGTTIYGSPGNSLHVSAQSWGFFLILSVLVSLGLAKVVDKMPGLPTR